MEINNTAQILLYLLNCAVNERIPEKLPSDTNFEELKKLSIFHSVTAITSYALDAGGYLSEKYMSEEMVRFWTVARIKAMNKIILFDNERTAILRHFETCGVWYAPLKGCILKDLYPDIGMREMTDNDILIDRNYQSWLRDYMVERGYKTISYDKTNHDVYRKPPLYNFEFHMELVDKKYCRDANIYYKNAKERLLKDKNNQYGYHFSNEDFYIYMIVHTLKHYYISGIGIRTLMDIYVYLKAKSEIMDWVYIENELTKLGYTELETKIREIAQEVFEQTKEICSDKSADSYNGVSEKSCDEPACISGMLPEDEEKRKIFEYLLVSGTYGTMENNVKNNLNKLQNNKGKYTVWTKCKFIARRLFPNVSTMGSYAPFCRHHKWAIPFFWVYRIVRAVLKHNKIIISEIRTIKKV